MAPPLISVIIPVYRVAKYLPECLDSVLGQDGPPIEVIAVDDASPDASGAILDQRAAADGRLRVIHLADNRGQGRARLTGLGQASGDYIWFVDGDDRIADGALAAIGARLAGADNSKKQQPADNSKKRGAADNSKKQAADADNSKTRPDVLLIDWVSSYPDGRVVPSPGRELLAAVPPAGATLAAQPRLIDLTMTVWSKLLRREFLAGLGTGFGPGIHEDVPLTCAALLGAESIQALDRVCYCYRSDRPGSAMATSGFAHLAVFTSYAKVFSLLDQTPVSDAVRTAIFERAIWHYSTVLEARGPDGTGLVPPFKRADYFRTMHREFRTRRPPGYRFPPGPRGIKFRLVAIGSYSAYALLARLNRVRVAAAADHGHLAPGTDETNGEKVHPEISPRARNDR